MPKPSAALSAIFLALGLATAAHATSVAKTFTVSNTGNGPLTVSGATITGNTAEYALTGNTCGTVAAGANCALTVTFTPAGAGPRAAASLNFSSNGTTGTTQSISLGGTGAYALNAPNYPAAASCQNGAWMNTGFAWMWTASNGCSTANPGLFRFQTLVSNTTSGNMTVRVYAAADNGATLYVDGQQVSPYRYYPTYNAWPSFDAVISPGTHRFELQVVNDGASANPAAFSAAFVNVSTGAIIRSTSDVSAWSYY